MADKLVLNEVTNLQSEASALQIINDNYAAIETAFNNTFSRDGTAPNFLDADVDLNSNRLINLGAPVGLTDAVRLVDIADLDSASISQIVVDEAQASADAAAASAAAAAVSASASADAADDATDSAAAAAISATAASTAGTSATSSAAAAAISATAATSAANSGATSAATATTQATAAAGSATAAASSAVTAAAAATDAAEDAVAGFSTALSAEITNRETGDTTAMAAIATEATARASAVSAETSARTSADSTLTSGLATANAAITTEATTRAAADTAETAARTSADSTLTSGLSTANAAITTEATTRASADTAIAGTVTTLSASFTSLSDDFTDLSDGVDDLAADVATNTAAISTEATARASADTAIASTVTTLTATVGTKARIYIQPTQPSSGMNTNDQWIDTDDDNKLYYYASGGPWTLVSDGRIAANTAAISSEATTRATADSALASSVSTLGATVSGQTVSISTVEDTLATLGGDLYGNYSVIIDNDGVLTGFRLLSEGGGGGAISEFRVTADMIVFETPAGDRQPFEFDVGDGVAYLQNVTVDGDLVVHGTIITDHLTANAVTNIVSYQVTTPAAVSFAGTSGYLLAEYIVDIDEDDSTLVTFFDSDFDITDTGPLDIHFHVDSTFSWTGSAGSGSDTTEETHRRIQTGTGTTVRQSATYIFPVSGLDAGNHTIRFYLRNNTSDIVNIYSSTAVSIEYKR